MFVGRCFRIMLGTKSRPEDFLLLVCLRIWEVCAMLVKVSVWLAGWNALWSRSKVVRGVASVKNL